MAEWYVIQTSAGSQLQHRRYKYVEVKSKKTGKKLKPQLVVDKSEKISAVEHELEKAGFEYYMPVEHKLIINHVTKEASFRRFALLKGYAFVQNVTDWALLERVNGVEAILSIQGVPQPISEHHIIDLKAAEENMQELADRQAENLRIMEERAERMREDLKVKVTRAKAKLMYPKNTRIKIQSALFGIMEAIVKEATGRKTLKVELITDHGSIPSEINLMDIVA